MEDYKREILDDLKRRKVELKCPSCGSINVTISEAVRKLLTRSNLVCFLVGLLMIAIMPVAVNPGVSSTVWGLSQFFWVFLIVVVIGGGAFGLPVPILGNFLGRTFEIRIECFGCHRRSTRVFRTEFSK